MNRSGILFLILLWLLLAGWRQAWALNPDSTVRRLSYSVFPILMYDSDIGFGFGGKGTVKNIYQREESFDLILFASSKGEQWYVFTFSVPDFELRQGKRYPLALDLRVEYDKRLKSNFFGIGNDSRDNDFQFVQEFGKAELTLGRAFTRRLIGEVSYRFTHYSIYGYDPTWGTITDHTPGAGESQLSLLSGRVRWDSRDSQIQPRRGFRAYYSLEYCPETLGGDWDFTKHRVEISVYRHLFGQHILAGRLWLQEVRGSAPYPEMSKIGDSWTARGYKADRFLDRAMILASLEYRFPLFRQLGGVVFSDAGRVASKAAKLGLADWHANWGLGLRYYLENFAVRMDVGVSPEGTRLFFNFGHVF
ncbi:MAG: hypothetical protein Kow0042_20830 [Calditrichia bacterium]